MSILHTLASWIVSGLIVLGLVPSPVAAPVSPEPTVGAALPAQDALIDTYLAAGISKTDTSMTLAAGTSRDGVSLSGYYCFTIDINTPTVEYVCGTASGTSVTSLSRGVKVSNPTQTSTSLAFAHRRFASVQVTDFPFNQLVQRRMNGTDAFESTLFYNSAKTPTFGHYDIPTWDYVKTYADSLANTGAANADTVTLGLVEIATPTEVASSTPTGSTGGILVVPASAATSTPTRGCDNTSTAGKLCAVIAGLTGKISQTFLDIFATANTWSLLQTFTTGFTSNGASTFNATTTVATSTLAVDYDTIATVVASTTFTGYATPQPAYIATSTGTLNLSDANAPLAQSFDGFAVSSAANGGQVLLQREGIVTGFSGLAPGADYYVQDAVGTIGTSVGTSEVYVGRAISGTQLLMERNKAWQYLGSQTVTTNADTVINQPLARYAVIAVSVNDGGSRSSQGDVVISKIGKVSGVVGGSETGGASSSSWSETLTWTSTSSIRAILSCSTGSGACSSPSASATAYYYR